MRSYKKIKDSERFSIIQDSMENCYFCRMPKQDIHECINGPFREKSKAYGLCVGLCRKHHDMVHKNGKETKELKQLAQRVFEEKYSHELWIKEFRKNYL